MSYPQSVQLSHHQIQLFGTVVGEPRHVEARGDLWQEIRFTLRTTIAMRWPPIELEQLHEVRLWGVTRMHWHKLYDGQRLRVEGGLFSEEGKHFVSAWGCRVESDYDHEPLDENLASARTDIDSLVAHDTVDGKHRLLFRGWTSNGRSPDVELLFDYRGEESEITWLSSRIAPGYSVKTEGALISSPTGDGSFEEVGPHILVKDLNFCSVPQRISI